MDNKSIAQLLGETADLLEIAAGDPFRIRSYRRAAEAVENSTEQLSSFVHEPARLLAIQGQDPRGARLAVRVRSQGLSAADIDHALTADRTLVISWLNRGTLHLVRSADYWMLHWLTTPQLETGCARRLAQEGIPPVAADRAANRALTCRPRLS